MSTGEALPLFRHALIGAAAYQFMPPSVRDSLGVQAAPSRQTRSGDPPAIAEADTLDARVREIDPPMP